MDSRRRSAEALAALVVAGLSGCGSSSGADPIAVTFSPAVATASFAQGSRVGGIPVTATLSRLPDANVRVVVQQDRPVLSGAVSVTQTGPTTFQAGLQPICTLAPGTYAGNLTLRLCEDASCRTEVPLRGNVLPYSLTVSAGHILTASLDGVAVPGIFAACTGFGFDAKVGQVVRLTSTVPVTWSHSIGYSAGTPVVTGLSTTDTTWTATVSEYNGFHTPGVHYGIVNVYAGSLFVSMWVVGW